MSKSKLIGLILFCSLFISCKKELMDYRNKFTGDFAFKVHEVRWVGASTYTVLLDTTYNYNGYVENGSDYCSVNIQFSKDNAFELTIYEDGSLSGRNVYGYYENVDNIYLKVFPSALGGGTNYEINAVRR
ncbi:MAG: hypothetical protein NTZ33_01980 [Bacteroidetes bacterium]|nr:hypothetical protein [Bacteroidota bacterium]